MNTVATPEFLSPSEVARRLGLSRSTVYRHIARGDLPALRLGQDGRSLRVRADVLETWLEPTAAEGDGRCLCAPSARALAWQLL
jgi:excisionase family DNA binding protein